MSNVLSIAASPIHDNTIIKKEIYPYVPFTTTYNESEEIRIAIQSQDSYLLPSESYLYMQIACRTTGAQVQGDSEVHFVTNYPAYLFSDIRYEINGVEIERVRNTGRATTMKLKLATCQKNLGGYHEFCKTMEGTVARGGAETVYDLIIPLSALFGLCDDFRKIIINCKHELILNRARQSLDCTAGGGELATSTKVGISIRKLQWKMVHVTLSDNVKLKMLNYLAKNRKLPINFRSKDLVEYPQLPETTSLIWQVKTVSHVNRPRFVIIGLQTNRKGVLSRDATHFDSCNISELRLHINSQIYPYNMNEIDVGGAQYAELYHSNANIQSVYYNNAEPINPFAPSYGQLQSCTLFAFNTSYADESLIDSAVDIKVEIKTRENIPANTAAYCLIISDNEYIYSPFDGLIVRSI